MSSLNYLNLTPSFKSYSVHFSYSIHTNLILYMLSYIISKNYVDILFPQHAEHFRTELISLSLFVPLHLE